MFLNELTPIFQELTQHPVSFLGGFFSGILRLNLADDPIKSWLDEQAGVPTNPKATTVGNNGDRGPQSISID